jgi:anti-sigma B factor antagonist
VQWNSEPSASEAITVALSGKLVMGRKEEDVTEIVDRLLANGKRIIVFDLTAVTGIDSTGIGRFIASYHKILEVDGEMRMAGASAPLLHSFQISLLDQVFPFYATVEEALQG